MVKRKLCNTLLQFPNQPKKAVKALFRYSLKGIGKILPKQVKRAAGKVLSIMNVVRNRMRSVVNVQPLSEKWGFDRGMPIHRYYLEQFLREFSSGIRGHCLEFQEDSYTTRFGGSAVTKLDILNIDNSKPLVTIIADLTKPNDIPSNYFDCIICTHVLHIIFEFDKAISELYRILKPEGVLLVAVPHISMCNLQFHEAWRFTPDGLHLVLAKMFGTDNVTVRAYGNSLTAAGEIRGLVTHEFSKSELDYHDLRFAVEVCARSVKLKQS